MLFNWLVTYLFLFKINLICIYLLLSADTTFHFLRSVRVIFTFLQFNFFLNRILFSLFLKFSVVVSLVQYKDNKVFT